MGKILFQTFSLTIENMIKILSFDSIYSIIHPRFFILFISFLFPVHQIHTLLLISTASLLMEVIVLLKTKSNLLVNHKSSSIFNKILLLLKQSINVVKKYFMEHCNYSRKITRQIELQKEGLEPGK